MVRGLSIAIAMAFIAAAPMAVAKDVNVDQKGNQFVPGELTVNVGDAIMFTNADGVAHNVHSVTPDHRFTTGIQQPGESAQVTFDATGTIDVRCALHPRMRLTLKVE